MTDDTPNLTAPEAAPVTAPDATPDAAGDPAPGTDEPTSARPSTSADVRARRPDYKGGELDPERGPGLGCFWFQVIVLGLFIVLIPIGLNLDWPFEVLAILLFIVIGLLLLTGQTVIFLLRLVAADRRAQGRRRPLASPTKTVGELEDEHQVAHAVGSTPHAVPMRPEAPGPTPEVADEPDASAAPAPGDPPDASAGAIPEARPGEPDAGAAADDTPGAVAPGGAAPGDPAPDPEEPPPGVRQ